MADSINSVKQNFSQTKFQFHVILTEQQIYNITKTLWCSNSSKPAELTECVHEAFAYTKTPALQKCSGACFLLKLVKIRRRMSIKV